MTNLIIELPDDLAHSLELVAAAQRKSLQQLAMERLLTLVEVNPNDQGGLRRRAIASHVGTTALE
jgi:hypothetical protein